MQCLLPGSLPVLCIASPLLTAFRWFSPVAERKTAPLCPGYLDSTWLRACSQALGRLSSLQCYYFKHNKYLLRLLLMFYMSPNISFEKIKAFGKSRNRTNHYRETKESIELDPKQDSSGGSTGHPACGVTYSCSSLASLRWTNYKSPLIIQSALLERRHTLEFLTQEP